MKLTIPPVAQFLFIAITLYLIDWQLPQLAFSFEYQIMISRAFLITGLAIGVIAMAGFRKAKTTVHPMDPSKASTLVVTGLYKFTRNPMYLGMLCILGGLAIRLGNPLNIGMLIFFIWFMTQFQIKPEENILREKFGADYDDYCQKVRRWI